MKIKSLITVFLITILASTVYSQNDSRRLNRSTERDQRFIEFAEDLDLSPQQKKEMFELTKAHRAEMRKIGRGEDAKEMKKSLRLEYDRELQELLDEKQLEKYLSKKEEKKQKADKRKESRDKMKAYQEANITPFIKEQREKLESLLSEDEKEALEKIREQRPGKNRMRKRQLQNRGGQRARLSEHVRNELSAIIENHKSEIEKLHREIESKKEEWKDDMKEMRSEEEKRRKQKKKGKKRHVTKNREGDMKYFRFLLMDPND